MITSKRTPRYLRLVWLCLHGIQFPTDPMMDQFLSSVCETSELVWDTEPDQLCVPAFSNSFSAVSISRKWHPARPRTGIHILLSIYFAISACVWRPAKPRTGQTFADQPTLAPGKDCSALRVMCPPVTDQNHTALSKAFDTPSKNNCVYWHVHMQQTTLSHYFLK